MDSLTRREADFLRAVRDHIAEHQIAPTREELRRALRWKSVSTVTLYLKRLVDKGRLHVIPHSSRGIRLLDERPESGDIPIVGRVTAGTPLLSEKNLEATVPAATAATLFRTKPDFFLRVQGESMAGAEIHDGDLVAVRKACDARNGDIVVASVDGEATLKRLSRDNGHFALVPEHPDYQPIQLRGERFEIQGIVIGSLRPDSPR